MTDSTDPTDPTGPPTTSPPIDAVRLIESDETVIIEVTVAAPVATVWPHLRDPELIRRWHGWDYDGLDAEVDLIYVAQAEADETAHTIDMLGGPEPGSHELGDRFELLPDKAGSVVRITRGPRGTDPDWDAMYDDITQGWVAFLAQLGFAVEHHRGEERRTVFCASFAGPTARAQDLLGLVDVAVGEAYRPRTDGPLGESGGAVWFRTDAQVGLVVDDYGPGLLVVADKPGSTPGTADTSMIIVSTYGRSAEQFAAIEVGWQAWWIEHFPSPDQPG